MANFVLGKDCVAYYSATAVTGATNTALLAGVSGGTVISNIKDLKLNFQTDKTDISTRAGNGWKASAATLKDGTITFTMLWKPADATFTALLTAWLANAEVFFAALDGSTTGSQGPAGNFTITNFSRSEGLTDAVTVDVELSPSSFNGWVTKS